MSPADPTVPTSLNAADLDPIVGLYGSTRPESPVRTLIWGEWEATLESALLRNIRYRGTEVIRGIEFVGRDANWGTLPPNVLNLDLAAEHFNIDGTFHFEEAQVPWSACANLSDSGLSIAGRCEAPAPVSTNRTGFVLLHPLTCIGQPFEIEHPDGTTTSAHFPELIRPDQPAFNIRALRYAPAEGLELEIRFDGDVFEMEDQRNWLDASFKTYCRP
ncbi:MAG: hypothetical protein KDB18_09265, partial [Salinibacterium sp.]|nr:hypothetical protein [Salinibacterium sp.]